MTITGATDTMLGLAGDWADAIPSALLSGINGDLAHQTDPGKHLSRSDNISRWGSSCWPVVHAKDKLGPSDKACAIDMNMGRADQNAVHNRLITLYRNRATDPRAQYVFAFNGWNGTGSPMRYNLANGATAVTDDSHTWHEHVETYYQYVNDPKMRAAIMSVVRGETVAQYLGTAAQEDDEMISETHQLPQVMAYDEAGKLLDASVVLSFPLEPAGNAADANWKDKKLYLSFSTDHVPADASVKARLAVHDGAGWKVSYHNLTSGARVYVGSFTAKAGNAFSVTVGRTQTTQNDQFMAPIGFTWTIL